MTKVTVSSTREIILPAEITDQLKLKAGEEISVDVQGDVVIFKCHPPCESGGILVEVVKRLAPVPDWRTMRGMFKDGPESREGTRRRTPLRAGP